MKKAKALIVIALASASLVNVACENQGKSDTNDVFVIQEAITYENIEKDVVLMELETEDDVRSIYKIPTEYEANGGYMSEELLIFTEQLCADKCIAYPFVLAMIEHESGYRNLGSNDCSCIGYMQISEKWHKEEMERIGCYDLYNGFDNISVGVEILVDLFSTYEEPNKVLMAYNMGPSGAAKLWEQGIESSAYSRSILERAIAISNEMYGE